VLGEATKFVAREKIIGCTNCGMAPMRRDIAMAKLSALAQGAALARRKFA
jgi:5-methyltetrahydropteroyltriglutamate--homocysteine methyltransferase